MSPLKQLIPIVLLSYGFSPVYATDTSQQLQSAQKRVAEYRTLRASCTATEGAERKSCFRQLNAKTPMYIEDREFIARHIDSPRATKPLLTSQIK